MDKVAMKLSAFGDEIGDDIELQLETLRKLRIGALEFRAAWGKNVLHFGAEEAQAISKACTAHQIIVSSIGSPIGKVPITRPLESDLADLECIIRTAEVVGTQLVRVFSYYPPEPNERAWSEEELVGESINRLTILAEKARQAGIALVLENESVIVGDTIARCLRILEGVRSSDLNFAWDPGNFSFIGELNAVDDGWELLGPRIRSVHIKDHKYANKEPVPAGDGDGQIDHLLSLLATAGYGGYLALEPHLVHGGRMGGFSGVEGMTRATGALRTLMAKLGIEEQSPAWAEKL